jgi:plasmid stabilization system protein ParE
MFQLDIHPEAIIDIETAALWYEERKPGLGTDFSRTIRHSISTLPANPLIYRIRDRRRNIRWVLSSRFPFRIVYRVKENLVTVIAVIHAARYDHQWTKRTSG